MTVLLAEIVVWLLIAAFSVWIGLLDVRDMRDESADLLDGSDRDFRRAIVGMHVRSATKRFVTALFLLAIGVLSLLVNVMTDALDGTTFGVAFSVAMFSILLWNLAVQLIDRSERRRLIREVNGN